MSRYRFPAQALVAIALAFTLQVGLAGSATSASGDGRLAALFGGRWSLTDVNGRAVTERTWLGQVVLLYFGYRSCPDICPTDLQTIGQALDQMGQDAAQVQPLFVTVDPERDTADHLAEFTAQFHPRIIGLTGTPDQIASMAKTYRVSYRKVPAPGGDYFIDHSAAIYLIDRGGKTAAVLGPETTGDMLVAAIKKTLSKSTD